MFYWFSYILYVDLHVTLLASQHQFEATPIESYSFELVELSTLGG